MCNVSALITNSELLLDDDGEVDEESLTAEFVSPFVPSALPLMLTCDVGAEGNIKCFSSCCRWYLISTSASKMERKRQI
jgi:hypothetical protein